jgi:hypothetical protein
MDRLAIIGSFLSVTAATVVVAIGARCYMVPHPLDHEHPAPRAHRNQHE